MPNIGPVELIIILVIALLIIGPGKLPEVGTALGKSIREFRKAATDVQDAAKLDVPPTTPTPATPAQTAPVAPTVAPAAPVAAAPAPEPASAAPVEAQAVAPAAAEPQANVLSDAAAPNEISQPGA